MKPEKVRSPLAVLTERILGDTTTDLRGLLFPWYQSELISSRRSSLIISRVRLIALLFAVLTPMWIAVDVMFLSAATSFKLAAGRLTASATFALLSILYRRSDRPRDAYVALGLLFLIPSAFFLYSHILFRSSPVHLTGLSASLVTGYAFLPFVMAAGLSVFPLTVLEGVAFALPAFVVQAASSIFAGNLIVSDAYLGLLWLFMLIAMVAVLAGMSQLHYLTEIITKSAHDPLTKGFNRVAGEELMEKYYLLAKRANTPLTLVFLDLDDFKSVNDRYGHEAGDDLLRNASSAILKAIRREDLLIRWGGEEFLIVLPNTGGHGPASIVKRLGALGIGLRPDGTPLTASLGQAEHLQDKPADLANLIEIADKRMYRAKRSGKNGVCFGDHDSEFLAAWVPTEAAKKDSARPA